MIRKTGDGYWEIDAIHGDTIEFDLTVISPINGLPVTIVGSTIVMVAKEDYADEDADAVINISTPTDIEITDGANGKAHVAVPAGQTASVPNRKTRLPFDIQVSTPNGKKWTVAHGHITLSPEVAIV